jgi:hypothetical protein
LARDLFDWLIRTVVVVVFGVGAFTLAWPWVRETAGPLGRDVTERRLPGPGVVCFDIIRSTERGRTRDRKCDTVAGWHWERIPGGGDNVMAIPDEARPIRRREAVDRW